MSPLNYIHKKLEPSLFSLPTSNQMPRLINSISWLTFKLISPDTFSLPCLKSRHQQFLPGPPKLSLYINFPKPWPGTSPICPNMEMWRCHFSTQFSSHWPVSTSVVSSPTFYALVIMNYPCFSTHGVPSDGLVMSAKDSLFTRKNSSSTWQNSTQLPGLR